MLQLRRLRVAKHLSRRPHLLNTPLMHEDYAVAHLACMAVRRPLSAAARAPGTFMQTKALMWGCQASQRATQASNASTGVTSPRAKPAASCAAFRRQSSFMKFQLAPRQCARALRSWLAWCAV